MPRWMTLEEWAAEHGMDANLLHVLAVAGRLPHRLMLGRIYVSDQEMERWERQGKTDPEAG